MNKHEFIKDLQKRLKQLPQSDINNALNYYVEYFEDANTSAHEDVTLIFGHPSSIASDILADYAVNHPVQVKTKTSSIWFVVLAILAAPIGLPLG
ncbi:MAG TPA: hypothetical protein DCY20_03185, partial [Firmicutes bacterium]|nr:hypothetical protein [Bacillota bacterium]